MSNQSIREYGHPLQFRALPLREQNSYKYWSKLYRQVWKRLHQEKAVLDREFQYALEPEGFPPIDVDDVVNRFARRHVIRRIDRLIPELSTTLTFWVVPGPYESDTQSHDEIIEHKIELHKKRTEIQHKLGNAMVTMVHLASMGTEFTFSTKLTQVKDWNGKRLKQDEGEIDIVLISFKRNKTYGIEAKNVAPIIDSGYARAKLRKHFDNCDKLGMTPVFVLSRIFSTTSDELEQAGATVVETKTQFYQLRYWPIAKSLKQSLGYHFVRRMGHHASVHRLSSQLVQKLK